MREVRIEVLSESEARDYCNIHNLIFDECYEEDGRFMLIAYDNKTEDLEPEVIEKILKDKLEDTFIYADTINGRMYLADSKKSVYPTTFDRSLAKKFTYANASKRVVFMNRNGSYNWKTYRKE